MEAVTWREKSGRTVQARGWKQSGYDLYLLCQAARRRANQARMPFLLSLSFVLEFTSRTLCLYVQPKGQSSFDISNAARQIRLIIHESVRVCTKIQDFLPLPQCVSLELSLVSTPFQLPRFASVSSVMCLFTFSKGQTPTQCWNKERRRK